MLSLNQQTVKQWSLPDLVEGCAQAGVTGVGLWREPVAAYGLDATARLIRRTGLEVTSLCRGGFLTIADPAGREERLRDNRAAIAEAATLGTDTLVLVCGGLPEGGGDLRDARERVTDAIADLVPFADSNGVRLAVEPLHPMFASDRSVVSTLAQALRIAEQFPADQVGVVIDTYHLWWDDTVDALIQRAGAAGRIAAFQVADWTTPLPYGVLTGRGQLGDGCIDLRHFREQVAAAGYNGYTEVEIFNEDMWARDPAQVLEEILDRYRTHVL
jgi:sugar phosphate isomerase/epimerase